MGIGKLQLVCLKKFADQKIITQPICIQNLCLVFPNSKPDIHTLKLRIQIYKNTGAAWVFEASFYEIVPVTTIPVRAQQSKHSVAIFYIL